MFIYFDSVFLAQELERRFPALARDVVQDVADAVEEILPNCLTNENCRKARQKQKGELPSPATVF